ncbi:hypothetical protein H8356DRAFT_1731442 [Neocallimastix lanati (nom. inval.)]|jgi:multidrug transporter EmrE-like cation transporter|uniref:Protein transport protein SFT2 n=1 Tax=Neocallimastix californiae TaxID=1754190 RepID=A0A1Y2C021_9FUNG|nr:hypothetical protein H8356DRAFT_1731442 [Neocallimastix sp. JGI-2020a]ORY40326.1 hypothetical protein LY90DRAFT_672236 [Neocallimastix californiae]|eukprot:ORY40326.1 hypothetical protein LY90DRAFT_672236 [Neocallimastix californiae]
MDFKKFAEDFVEDTNEVFKDIKKKAKKTFKTKKLKESIENVTNKTKEGTSNIIINITEEVSDQFEDFAKATTSAYNNVSNSLSDSVENVKSYTPDKLFSSMIKKVWKEDEKVLGFITITRGQKIYYSLAFIISAILFLGMDLSLLFVAHEFENIKYAVFYSIWTLSYVIGIHILDSAIPKQFFEKKTRTVRTIAIVIYCIALISNVVIAIVLPRLMFSIIAFFVQLIPFAWLTTTHIPTYKGINLSYFNEKSPLLFSNFYNSVEK